MAATATGLPAIPLPPLAAAALSISHTKFVTFLPEGFARDWHGAVLRDPDLGASLAYSAWLAAGTTAGATEP